MRLAWTLLLLAVPAWAQDYADEGPLTIAVTSGSVTVQQVAFPYDVYAPTTGGPFPIIALGHGFSNSRNAMRALARSLATRGSFVVVPQFPFLDGNHARNADAMLAALDAVAAANPTRVDATRQGVAGHSAGGLSAMRAALTRTSLKAVALLDAVDSNPALSAAQLSGARSPVLMLFAEPAMCNSQGNSAAWYASLSAVPRGRFKVTSALHCDPTDPPDATCTFGCPGTDTQRARRFRRAAVAWLQYFVSCELAARSSIDGAEFQASKAAGNLGAEQFDGIPGAPCGTPDGGTGAGGGAGGSGAGGGGGGSGGSAGGGSAGGGSAGDGNAGGGSAGGGSTGGGSTGGGSAGGGSAGGGSAGGGSTGGGSTGGGSAGGGNTGGGAVEPGRGCGCATGGDLLLVLALVPLFRRRSGSTPQRRPRSCPTFPSTPTKSPRRASRCSRRTCWSSMTSSSYATCCACCSSARRT